MQFCRKAIASWSGPRALPSVAAYARSVYSSPRMAMTTSSSHAASLKVSPQKCLQDEPVGVTVTGLEQGGSYTISSTASDNKGVPFFALAHYRANDSGSIDVSKDPSLGGHFIGVFPMGLFYNIMPSKSDDKHHRFSYKDINESVNFDLSVYEGFNAPHIAMMGAEAMGLEPVCSTQHQRSIVAPGCTRVPVKHGRVRGVLHLPPGPGPFPGVVDMFGSAGGLMEHRSAMLANRGIASLALAFFDYEDLPKEFSGFDIPYFEEAVDYLISHEKVYSSGVGAIGVSKGGDLVLNMARHIPLVKAGVVINGCIANFEATLTLKDGREVPGLKYDFGRVKLLRDGVIEALEMTDDPLDHPESIIHVEEIPGDILWIAGLDDRNWNSGYYADLALERYRKFGKGSEDKIQVIKYPGTGHLIEPPYTPFCDLSYHKIIRGGMKWGGEAQSHCEAQVDSWQKILEFIKEKITPASDSKL